MAQDLFKIKYRTQSNNKLSDGGISQYPIATQSNQLVPFYLSTPTRTLEPHPLDHNFLSDSSTWHPLGRSDSCPINLVDIHHFIDARFKRSLYFPPCRTNGVVLVAASSYVRSLNSCFFSFIYPRIREHKEQRRHMHRQRTLIPKSPFSNLSFIHYYHPPPRRHTRISLPNYKHNLLSWVNFFRSRVMPLLGPKTCN